MSHTYFAVSWWCAVCVQNNLVGCSSPTSPGHAAFPSSTSSMLPLDLELHRVLLSIYDARREAIYEARNSCD